MKEKYIYIGSSALLVLLIGICVFLATTNQDKADTEKKVNLSEIKETTLNQYVKIKSLSKDTLTTEKKGVVKTYHNDVLKFYNLDTALVESFNRELSIMEFMINTKIADAILVKPTAKLVIDKTITSTLENDILTVSATLQLSGTKDASAQVLIDVKHNKVIRTQTIDIE